MAALVLYSHVLLFFFLKLRCCLLRSAPLIERCGVKQNITVKLLLYIKEWLASAASNQTGHSQLLDRLG